MALLAPAVWSSLAIVFAESISDYGVASTLANDAHFPIATFELENAVGNIPGAVPRGRRGQLDPAGFRWPDSRFYAQHRALRGRSYRVLGGRTRPARRRSAVPVPEHGSACSAECRCCSCSASACRP